MGDWPPGVILSCRVWLSGTPVPPNALPPAQKPKLRQQLSSHSVRDEDHAMTIAEYAILSVLIAAVVVSLGLAFSEREF